MTSEPLGWNERRLTLLRELLPEGLSASQIAAQLSGGISRAAVIAKIYRLGLRDRWAGVSLRRNGAATARRRRPMAMAPRIAKPAPRPPQAISEPTPPIQAAKPVRYFDRCMGRECSRILNFGALSTDDLMVCGGPIPEESAFEFCAVCAKTLVVQVKAKYA